MKSKIFGYARVSSKEQNEERQLVAFKEYGIDERDIYIDKQSGKDFNRENYITLKHILRENDLLVIKSIDRLGRNYNQIIDEWKDITKNIKADIVVIEMPLLDTRKNKDLLGTFISDLVLQILSYVAEQERTFIKQRQKEGITNAKKNALTTAILIPTDVKSNIPKAKPIKPFSLAISIAPWIKRWPNDVIGIIAPAPQYRTILSYIPEISSKAPITTNRLVTCPGVSFVLSKIN